MYSLPNNKCAKSPRMHHDGRVAISEATRYMRVGHVADIHTTRKCIVGVMEDNVNIVVYHNGVIIRNTYEEMSFVSTHHDIRETTIQSLSKHRERYFKEGGQYSLQESGVANLEDEEFSIKMEYSSRKSTSRQFGATLSLEESIMLFMSSSHRRSIQNA
ncbi:hypothetical protein AHAS_Ahas02G0069000 [Arachis hypogaea]